MVGTEFTGVEPLSNSRGKDGVATTVVIDSRSPRDGEDGHFSDYCVSLSDERGWSSHRCCTIERGR